MQNLLIKLHRNQSRTFNLPIKMKVQKFGFQYQEDGVLVENEERSVRSWYVSTEDFAIAPYSMPSMLLRTSS